MRFWMMIVRVWPGRSGAGKAEICEERKSQFDVKEEKGGKGMHDDRTAVVRQSFVREDSGASVESGKDAAEKVRLAFLLLSFERFPDRTEEGLGWFLRRSTGTTVGSGTSVDRHDDLRVRELAGNGGNGRKEGETNLVLEPRCSGFADLHAEGVDYEIDTTASPTEAFVSENERVK
jgi:hypothetical protein